MCRARIRTAILPSWKKNPQKKRAASSNVLNVRPKPVIRVLRAPFLKHSEVSGIWILEDGLRQAPRLPMNGGQDARPTEGVPLIGGGASGHAVPGWSLGTRKNEEQGNREKTLLCEGVSSVPPSKNSISSSQLGFPTGKPSCEAHIKFLERCAGRTFLQKGPPRSSYSLTCLPGRRRQRIWFVR
jgi:hypothetical protein